MGAQHPPTRRTAITVVCAAAVFALLLPIGAFAGSGATRVMIEGAGSTHKAKVSPQGRLITATCDSDSCAAVDSAGRLSVTKADVTVQLFAGAWNSSAKYINTAGYEKVRVSYINTADTSCYIKIDRAYSNTGFTLVKSPQVPLNGSFTTVIELPGPQLRLAAQCGGLLAVDGRR